MPILCLSSARFHPELKESFLSHIYACLTKPIDPDELRYWLRSIQEDERNRGAAGKISPTEPTPSETEEKWKNRNP
jgi:hypothetical protein